MTEKERKFVDSLSLKDLDLPDSDVKPGSLREEYEKGLAEQEQFRKFYGKDWFKKWCEYVHLNPDYDVDLKSVNSAIYYGSEIMMCTSDGSAIMRIRNLLESRRRELYGSDYDRLRHHEKGDLEVVELLLADAVKTGKWKELPDCLQEEYHKRVAVR